MQSELMAFISECSVLHLNFFIVISVRIMKTSLLRDIKKRFLNRFYYINLEQIFFCMYKFSIDEIYRYICTHVRVMFISFFFFLVLLFRHRLPNGSLIEPTRRPYIYSEWFERRDRIVTAYILTLIYFLTSACVLE
jgi:hypothetical protein